MDGRAGAVPVLNDAQFSLTATLRPYQGFDAQPGGAGTGSYQGVAGTTPILFTEGGKPLDPLAGTTGYSKRLVKGLSVPFGARVSIWVPAATLFRNTVYDWFVIWRQRNVFDYRVSRLPFHYPKQGQGQADTTAGDAGPRVVIPSAYQTIVFNGIGPGFGNAAATSGDSAQSDAQELLKVASVGFPFGTPPLLPPIPGIAAGVLNGVIEQGIIDPNALGLFTSSWITWDMQAVGDEMIVGCIKDANLRNGSASGTTNWDFTVSQVAGGDNVFGILFGNTQAGGFNPPFPDFGVYVNVGVAT